MAKSKKWTIISAFEYKENATKKGLTYWSAYDYLKKRVSR